MVLSHRNMVAGALSVASYLENAASDVILSALPLSFDAGFCQLTTGFSVGARVVLLNYLLPRDVLDALAKERVTGLTAVPPLWIQLSQLNWPASIAEHLRYIANTGGRMPRETLAELRRRLPRTKPYLDVRPDRGIPVDLSCRPRRSIGGRIPSARRSPTPRSWCCARTARLRRRTSPANSSIAVRWSAMGYWNDPEKTAERFKPLPVGVGGRESGMVMPELAVFSGDTVRRTRRASSTSSAAATR